VTTSSPPLSLQDEVARLWGSDPDAMADPSPLWRRLHEEAPVYRFRSSWLFSRHADVKTILTHSTEWFGAMGVPRESEEAAAILAQLDGPDRDALEQLMEFESLFMSRTGDFTRHARLRRIAHRAFVPRRIAEMRAITERYTDELLDELEGGAKIDLAEFCYRLPLMVMASILGVPHDEHELVHSWSNKLARATHRNPIDPVAIHEGLSAMKEFRGYVDRIVEQHRGDPASVSSLVGSMLDAEQGEQATPDELTAMFVNFLFAGHETTSNLIAIGLAGLLQSPDEWRRLADDPSLAADATEELLRFVSPAQFGPIDAAQDFELGGVRVRKGDTVVTVLAAANRDPAVFADPDTLDLTRANARDHLAFGIGPRYCLGQALARLEGEIVFSELARRFPELTLDADRLEFHGVSMLRRLKSLPVSLGAPRPAA
jgi:cytochrome P450